MKKLYLGLLISLSVLLVACQTSDATHQKTSEIIQHLDNNAFKEVLSHTENAQLIDVRTPNEVANGTLPQAIHMNINESDFEQQIATLDKSKPVFVYCAAGGRSKKAAKAFKAQGFDTIYELDKGFNAWEAAGLPIEK